MTMLLTSRPNPILIHHQNTCILKVFPNSSQQFTKVLMQKENSETVSQFNPTEFNVNGARKKTRQSKTHKNVII